MEWSTHEVVSATGITSRTLRHYDQIGLLKPSSLSAGGLRHYNQLALVRLQRILLLRELGLPLADIAAVLEGQSSDITALQQQRQHLLRQKERIDAQMRSVEDTINALRKGETIMPKTMFEGFDHSQYEDEVRQRWGDDAAQRSNTWWDGLGEQGRQRFQQELEDLNDAWDQVIAECEAPVSEAAQDVAERHVRWLGSSWQTAHMPRSAVKGIAQMYVDDERFAANYTRVSPAGAQFVCTAVQHYADQHLTEEP
ncbi:MerR family transcriptional regulator [Nesterenkonia muleiensis]|uniref:MerR family transcriptional regulator n=1 Tax=Nesterenkonia muleiensis TaxID=2282648 RepID=UPI000E738AFE|nr:TipAS antibiotic-recognition domain-containing protein [Nesterenkonia muleiensis]